MCVIAVGVISLVSCVFDCGWCYIIGVMCVIAIGVIGVIGVMCVIAFGVISWVSCV